MAIGIGKAARRQERAAQATRVRHIERSGATRPLPEVGGAVACAGCGERVPRADVMFGADGGLCPVCFGDEESAVAAARVESPWLRTVVQSAAAVPFLLWTGLFLVNLPEILVELWRPGMAGAAFCVLLVPGVVACMVALAPLRDLSRSVRRPVEGERDGAAIAAALVAAAITGLPALVLSVFGVFGMVLPLL